MIKILAIHDDPRYGDRYTVVLDQIDVGGRQCLGMSANPTFPTGICQHSTCKPGPHLGNEINYDELPESCQDVLKEYEYNI